MERKVRAQAQHKAEPQERGPFQIFPLNLGSPPGPHGRSDMGWGGGERMGEEEREGGREWARETGREGENGGRREGGRERMGDERERERKRKHELKK